MKRYVLRTVSRPRDGVSLAARCRREALTARVLDSIIGYLLDRGKCKLSYDLPEVDALATFVNPDTNTTMFLGVDGECKSALTSCLADNEQAVIDGYRDAHEDAFAARGMARREIEIACLDRLDEQST